MATMETIHSKVVSNDEWLDARRKLLAKEKELTHQRDALNAERRSLPWVKVEKDYVFETSEGKEEFKRSFRWTEPADYSALHAWAGMERGLCRVLVPCGPR